jgi:hypothetical protein
MVSDHSLLGPLSSRERKERGLDLFPVLGVFYLTKGVSFKGEEDYFKSSISLALFPFD